MRVYSASDVHAALSWTELATALSAAFAEGAVVPLRHAHALSDDDILLLMPAWSARSIGLKLVTVLPGASKLGAPTVGATYLLIDRESGVPRALMDGDALTVRRTAAVSAIAAQHCAVTDASSMVMVGTGHLAPYMIRAHCALRPSLTRVMLWGRHHDRAQALAQTLADEGLPVTATPYLEAAVRSAHIISCATTSTAPIVKGEWIQPGTHIDLVGGFTHAMREVDSDAVAKSRISVDTYDGVLAEAGDIVVPMEQGIITRDAIVAQFAQLVRGECKGRTHDDQITLFKSVGTGLSDLAAAQLVFSRGVS